MKVIEKAKEPYLLTLEEYKKEYFRPRSKYNEEAQDVWRTWQKQKLMGVRKGKLPYDIESFKELIDKMARDFHKYEVEKALKEGKEVPEKVLKDYPELLEEGEE